MLMYTCVDCTSMSSPVQVLSLCGWAIIMAGAVVPIDFTPYHSPPHESDVATILPPFSTLLNSYTLYTQCARRAKEKMRAIQSNTYQ